MGLLKQNKRNGNPLDSSLTLSRTSVSRRQLCSDLREYTLKKRRMSIMETQSQLISIPRTTNTNKATRLGAIIAFGLLAIGLFGVVPLGGAHAQTGVTSQVSVETLTNTGSSLSGYYVSLWQNGVLNGSCYSACAFTVTNGVHYQVAVSDYGGWCFSDWQGGTPADTKTYTSQVRAHRISSRPITRHAAALHPAPPN